MNVSQGSVHPVEEEASLTEGAANVPLHRVGMRDLPRYAGDSRGPCFACFSAFVCSCSAFGHGHYERLPFCDGVLGRCIHARLIAEMSGDLAPP